MAWIFKLRDRYGVGWREGALRQRKLVGTREEADAVRLEIERQLHAHQPRTPEPAVPPPASRTLNDALDEWMARRKFLRSTPNDGVKLRKNVRPVLGGKQLAQITPADLDDLFARLRETHAPSSVKYIRALLRRLFNDGMKWGWVTKNPVKLTDNIKVPRDREFNILTKVEIARLLAMTPPAASALYACAVFTAMRRGEILALKWTDIDLERRQICVARSTHGATKSGKLRHVPIHPDLVRILDGWRLLCPTTADRWVFPGPNGKMRVSFTLRGFPRHLRDAGCHPVRFHDLRHTAISHYLMSGVPIRTVQSIAGHSSVTVTELYAHLIPGHAQQEIARFKLEPDGDRPVAVEDDPSWRKPVPYQASPGPESPGGTVGQPVRRRTTA